MYFDVVDVLHFRSVLLQDGINIHLELASQLYILPTIACNNNLCNTYFSNAFLFTVYIYIVSDVDTQVFFVS